MIMVQLRCRPAIGDELRRAASAGRSRLYGVGELSGVGTMICGLRLSPPASVAADGIVASLNAGPVMVARPGIGAIVTLLPKASVASVALAAALQAKRWVRRSISSAS
jgi:poly(3-hydroxybutyrate) depolymerase